MKKKQKFIELCEVASYLPIKELKFYPNNPRTISRERLDALKASIVEKGFYEPILVWSNNTVLAGNHRTRAALELINDGFTFVSPSGKKDVLPVVIDEEMSKEKAEAIVYETNNSYAEWVEEKLKEALAEAKDAGKDLASYGFTSDQIDELLSDALKAVEKDLDKTTVVGEHTRVLTDGHIPEDQLPDEDVDVKVRPGEVWRLGNHLLMCGDSTDWKHVEKLMGDDKADFCFTSPPYADQRTYNENTDLSPVHLSEFLTLYSQSCSLFAVNLGIARKEHEVLTYWDAYIEAAKLAKLKLLSWNVWNQGFCGSVGKLNAMFPISHEWIFVFGRERRDLNPTVPNKNAGVVADHTSDRQSDGSTEKKDPSIIRSHRELGTVVDCPPEMARDGIDHPARFPVKLAQEYIEACTNSGDMVVEPFGGSGTTLIACEKLGRKCRIMEIDPKYCQLIINRWELYSNGKAVKDGPVVLKPKRKKNE